ncbi:Hypothetical predicted protein, partial [Olea europaea subsp. europaea]
PIKRPPDESESREGERESGAADRLFAPVCAPLAMGRVWAAGNKWPPPSSSSIVRRRLVKLARNTLPPPLPSSHPAWLSRAISSIWIRAGGWPAGGPHGGQAGGRQAGQLFSLSLSRSFASGTHARTHARTHTSGRARVLACAQSRLEPIRRVILSRARSLSLARLPPPAR